MQYEKLIFELDKYIKENKVSDTHIQLKKDLSDIVTDLPKIKFLNLKDIEDFFGNEVSSKIKIYQMLFDSKYFSINKQQELNLLVLVNQMVDDLTKRINKSSMIMDVIKLKCKIEHIDNEYLTSSDLDLLDNFLTKTYPDIKERIYILRSLVNSSINYFNSMNIVDEEEEEIIEDSILEEDAINLFSEYGYDFNILEKNDKKYILKYGRENEMRKIFDVLKKYNLNINLLEFKSQFSRIIASSTEKIILTIIENIKTDSSNESLQLSFNSYMICPSIFIGKIRQIEDGGIDFPPIDGNGFRHPAGFENYMLNRKLFLTLGLSIDDIKNKCITIFETSHNKVMNNLSCLEFYDIPPERYLKCISCLNSSNMAYVIDRFIELDCLTYLTEHLYVTLKNIDSPIFYKIKAHRLKGGNTTDLYYGNTSKFKGMITNDNETFCGVNKFNGRGLVNQYDMSEEFDSSYYKDIDGKDFVYNIMVSCNSDIFNKLDNSKYKKDNQTYEFNGIKISRYKVLRYYEMLLLNNYPDSFESIRYCIFKDSILTKYEFRMIDNELRELYGKGIRR